MFRGVSRFVRRLFLILLAALAVGFLFRSEQMRPQRQAVRTLGARKNLIVHYDYRQLSRGASCAHLMNYDPAAKPVAPLWLRSLVGDDFLFDVAYLEVAPPYPPEETVEGFLARLPDCPVVYQ